MANILKFVTAFLIVVGSAAVGPSRVDAAGDVGAVNGDAAPAVLSAADAATYRRMFALGDEGAWSAVDRLAGQLEDPLLLGHVLAQRYLHPRYRSRYDELRAWLDRYADHPDAPRLYALALRRKPTVASRPPRPPVARARAVAERAGDGHAVLTAARDRHAVDDDAAGTITFSGGGLAAMTAVGFSHTDAGTPKTLWSAGLADWQQGDYRHAAMRFAAAAGHPSVSPWTASAAAFWAARAHFHARQPEHVNGWLRHAARYPRTFYGQLALRILDLPLPFDHAGTPEDRAAMAALADDAAGRRALALIQARQPRRAQAELRACLDHADAQRRRAVMLAADAGGLAELAITLEDSLYAAGGRIHAAGYPLAAWSPAGGYRTDRALVYAIVRQESRFDPAAVSPAGARGLMQLMPATAVHVSRRVGYALPSRGALADPAVNMMLGQRYIAMLLDQPGVDGDLFRLAVAWNAGPGNLERWVRDRHTGDDPLLFIETIPSAETRAFIERVLANLWIYRHRLGQPAPSLDRLASGAWPAYSALGDDPLTLARHEPH